jgi:hypothetical protein
MASPRVRRGRAGIPVLFDWIPVAANDRQVGPCELLDRDDGTLQGRDRALFAAKAVLILDGTPLERHLERYRRIVAVAVKTLIYGSITLLLGFLERLLEALRREHRIDAATRFVIDQASMNRLLAWALGITLVFGLYFALFEISTRMGKGKLWELFFAAPKFPEASGVSSQRSNVSVGNVRS